MLDRYGQTHYTILKFSSNYRACFGTIADYEGFIRAGIEQMVFADTFEETIQELIKNPIHVWEMKVITYQEWVDGIA